MRSLDAICETFAPASVEQGVPDAVLDAIEHDLTPRERQRLLLLLRTWLPGYSRLSQERPRERCCAPGATARCR